MIKSSMMCSDSGEHAVCTTNTSCSRTFSSILIFKFSFENRTVCARPSGIPRWWQISAASSGCEAPAKTLRLLGVPLMRGFYRTRRKVREQIAYTPDLWALPAACAKFGAEGYRHEQPDQPLVHAAAGLRPRNQRASAQRLGPTHLQRWPRWRPLLGWRRALRWRALRRWALRRRLLRRLALSRWPRVRRCWRWRRRLLWPPRLLPVQHESLLRRVLRRPLLLRRSGSCVARA